MIEAVKRLCVEEKGQGMAEYGLILALVAVVVIGTLTALGGGISEKFTAVKDGIANTPTTQDGGN